MNDQPYVETIEYGDTDFLLKHNTDTINNLNLLHMNIRSFPKNFDEFLLQVKSIN